MAEKIAKLSKPKKRVKRKTKARIKKIMTMLIQKVEALK